jgi:copper homeostasis protein
MPILLEACVDSVESAIAAEQGGAGRLELCADLIEGGTTPSAGMLDIVRRSVRIPVHVMIRPRGGDFCNTPAEFEVMRRDIAVAKASGADGVVFGLLTPGGEIDVERTRILTADARPLRVTFHRAFDMARDAHSSLEALIALGIERVLTSGQEQSALEGIDLIAALVRQAGERIIVMPGGGIHERNVRKVAAQSGAREIHASARTSTDGPMQYRNRRAFMGGELRPAEFSRSVSDPARVRAIRDACD